MHFALFVPDQPPRPRSYLNQSVVLLNRNVTLGCMSTMNISATFTFFEGNETIYSGQNNNTNITRVTQSSWYSCMVTVHDTDSLISDPVYLTVYSKSN